MRRRDRMRNLDTPLVFAKRYDDRVRILQRRAAV